ncbi:MAG: HNH endonuclease [Acidimicrobiia bacterium]
MKTTDDLEQELVELERHIGRVRARQVALLAELDRGQVALADGCRSMVEWTTGRLDVAPETALVRTFRTADPAVGNALAAGEVTFDRAVELSRLAATISPDPIARWAGFDIAGLRREHSRRHRLSRQCEAHVFGDRHVAMQPNLDRSSWRLWGELPGPDGRIVERALGERADTFPPLPDETRPSLGQQRADALTSIAQDSLTGTAGADTSTPLVTVFVDLDSAARTITGATLDSGPSVGPGALEEILCDSRIETILIHGATPLAVGRRTRVIGPALRRGILHRDGGACTADGCTSRHRLEVHHIIPASAGGPTDPANLTTLCWFHHHVVIHGLGYRIDPDTPPHRRRFLSPDRHDPP